MPAKLVPAIRTSYTAQEMIKGFIDGWRQQFEEIPSKKSIAIIWSQWSIETGQGKSCWNNNIGNVKYHPNKNINEDHIQYMMLNNVWEIINGKKIIYQPPHPATYFRAFDSLADGIAFHMGFLKGTKYKKAWEAIESGNPSNFAHLLKLANYYTASEEDYIKAVSLHFDRFMKDNNFEEVLSKLAIPIELKSAKIESSNKKSFWEKFK